MRAVRSSTRATVARPIRSPGVGRGGRDGWSVEERPACGSDVVAGCQASGGSTGQRSSTGGMLTARPPEAHISGST